MKLSDDMAAAAARPAPTFDVSTLKEESTTKKLIDRADVPVQIARVALLAFIIWFWESERIFDGISVFGLELFPEIPKLFRGTPSEAVDFLRGAVTDSLFWSDLQVTVTEAVLGFLIGAGAGFTVGMILGRFRRLARVLDPFLIFTNAIPKIALAPILILWYGVDIGSKVALAAIIVFFIVQIPIQSAVRGVDADLDTVASSLGASELQKFRFVIVPGILGPLFGALRLAAIYAILSVVLGEFIASKRGLGQRLIASTNQFNMGDAIALMTVLALLALLFNMFIGLLERIFLRWQDSEARGKVVSL